MERPVLDHNKLDLILKRKALHQKHSHAQAKDLKAMLTISFHGGKLYRLRF